MTARIIGTIVQNMLFPPFVNKYIGLKSGFASEFMGFQNVNKAIAKAVIVKKLILGDTM